MVIYFKSTLLGPVKIANKKVVISPGSARQIPVIKYAWDGGRSEATTLQWERQGRCLAFISPLIINDEVLRFQIDIMCLSNTTFFPPKMVPDEILKM